ncbi:MAG TPA: UDP-N-acetylglucosamine 2-epimerase (non-hydrolyzing) [Vicinamibacterales bacterium]
MKVCSVVGTRPNFVKEFVLNSELKCRGIREVLIHTGQHFDYEMSQVFFDCFELPPPDHHLQVANTDGATFLANAIIELVPVLKKEAPDCVLSYGDVNSTMAAAIAASRLRIPFAHVEGGIRSTERNNPEEINRRVSDVLADVIFCCTETDVAHLRKEGYEDERIVLSGDLMKDALMMTLRQYDITPRRGDYLVLTLHREENLTDRVKLKAIVEGIACAGRRVVFPAHPRTMRNLEQFGLMDVIAKSPIELTKPMGYVDFVRLAAGADKILTDSGGVRREAFLLGKPCIVLIELSWFPEISRAGWKVLTGPDSVRIAQLIREFEPSGPRPEMLFGDGMAHRQIAGELVRRYGR